MTDPLAESVALEELLRMGFGPQGITPIAVSSDVAVFRVVVDHGVNAMIRRSPIGAWTVQQFTIGERTTLLDEEAVFSSRRGLAALAEITRNS